MGRSSRRQGLPDPGRNLWATKTFTGPLAARRLREPGQPGLRLSHRARLRRAFAQFEGLYDGVIRPGGGRMASRGWVVTGSAHPAATRSPGGQYGLIHPKRNEESEIFVNHPIRRKDLDTTGSRANFP